MEEKEKRTSKEEEGSGYGLTADSDHCELTTDDRTPFSETQKHAVCKMPLVKRWVICLAGRSPGRMDHIPATAGTAEAQTLSPHLFIRWCGSSHCPVIVTLVPLAHHRQGRHPAEHRNLHRPPCTGTNYHYRRERQNHRIYPARHDHPPHIGGRKSRPFKCKQPSGIPQRVSSPGNRTVNLTGEATPSK